MLRRGIVRCLQAVERHRCLVLVVEFDKPDALRCKPAIVPNCGLSRAARMSAVGAKLAQIPCDEVWGACCIQIRGRAWVLLTGVRHFRGTVLQRCPANCASLHVGSKQLAFGRSRECACAAAGALTGFVGTSRTSL